MRGYQTGQPGFGSIPNALLDEARVDGRAKAIYARIGGTNRPDFTQKALADAAGVSSVTTVRKLLNQLIEFGWLYEFHQYDEHGSRMASAFVVPWVAGQAIEVETLIQMERDGVSTLHPVTADTPGANIASPPTEYGGPPPNAGGPPTESVGPLPQGLGDLPIYKEVNKKGGETYVPNEQGDRAKVEHTPPPPTNVPESPQGDALPLDIPLKGTRLPVGWTPAPKMMAWAREKFPALDLEDVTESFVSHYRQAIGRAGLSGDWDERWRTWIKRENRYAAERATKAAAATGGGYRRNAPEVRAQTVDPQTQSARDQKHKDEWAQRVHGCTYAEYRARTSV